MIRWPRTRQISRRLPDAIADGIRYAADHGARIIDLPLDPGTLGLTSKGDPAAAGGSPAERAAVGYALSKGVVLVAPAGDNGQGAGLVNYPAAYPGGHRGGGHRPHRAPRLVQQQAVLASLTAPGASLVAGPAEKASGRSVPERGQRHRGGRGRPGVVRFPHLTVAQVDQALVESTVAAASEAGLPALQGPVSGRRRLRHRGRDPGGGHEGCHHHHRERAPSARSGRLAGSPRAAPGGRAGAKAASALAGSRAAGRGGRGGRADRTARHRLAGRPLPAGSEAGAGRPTGRGPGASTRTASRTPSPRHPGAWGRRTERAGTAPGTGHPAGRARLGFARGLARRRHRRDQPCFGHHVPPGSGAGTAVLLWLPGRTGGGTAGRLLQPAVGPRAAAQTPDRLAPGGLGRPPPLDPGRGIRVPRDMAAPPGATTEPEPPVSFDLTTPPADFDLSTPAFGLTPPAFDLSTPAFGLTPPASDVSPPPFEAVPPASEVSPPAFDVSPPASEAGPPASPGRTACIGGRTACIGGRTASARLGAVQLAVARVRLSRDADRGPAHRQSLGFAAAPVPADYLAPPAEQAPEDAPHARRPLIPAASGT